MDELRELRRTEEKVVPGVKINTPRARLLDNKEAQKKNPDKHLRWVNIKDPEKAESRREDGYVRLSPEEGGKAIGDQLALFGIPKEAAENKRQAHKLRQRQLLNAHRAAVRNDAEQAVRELRDTSGLAVSAERILIDEKE